MLSEVLNMCEEWITVSHPNKCWIIRDVILGRLASECTECSLRSGFQQCCGSMLVLEEVIKRMWLLVDSWAEPRQLKASHSCPSNVHSTHCSHSGNHFQGHSAERVGCFGDHLDDICNRTRASLNLLRFWWVGGRYLLVSWLPATSLIGMFPSLLNLPPKNMVWSAFFFGFFLPLVFGGQFVNQYLATGEKARWNSRLTSFEQTWVQLRSGRQNYGVWLVWKPGVMKTMLWFEFWWVWSHY